MKNRIKYIRAYTGKSQTDFGNMFRVSKSAVQKWESGENIPADAVVELMAQKLGVNSLWLRTGVGEPFVATVNEGKISQLIEQLTDSPETFKTKVILSLLKLDAYSPEWKALENIYNGIANDLGKKAER